MMTILQFLAVFSAVTLIVGLFVIFIGSRKIKNLRSIVVPEDFVFPKLSVVIAARNEENTIAASLQSLKNNNYPNIEIIVVNDRSEDNTLREIESFTNNSNRIKILNIQTLPEGWLGKIYALQKGAESASGEHILFTDADVIFNKDSLKKAVYFFNISGTDHLAAAPEAVSKSSILSFLISIFAMYLVAVKQPWLVASKKYSASIGVGAFNLLKTSVYRKIGGHSKIRNYPDDDLKLGELVKKSGFNQQFIFADSEIFVEWYPGVAEMYRGLQKNFFAAFNYNPFILALTIIPQLLLTVFPFAGLFLLSDVFFLINFFGLLSLFLYFNSTKRFSNASAYYFVLFWAGCLFFMLIQVHATTKVLVEGGIHWRGTFYPLSILKKKHGFNAQSILRFWGKIRS